MSKIFTKETVGFYKREDVETYILLTSPVANAQAYCPYGLGADSGDISVESESEKIKDIFGIEWVMSTSSSMSQEIDIPMMFGSMEGITPKPNVVNPISQLVHDCVLAGEAKTVDALILFKYAGPQANTYDALHFPLSSFSFTATNGNGGEWLKYPTKLDFAGKREVGTATKDEKTGKVTYTAPQNAAEAQKILTNINSMMKKA